MTHSLPLLPIPSAIPNINWPIVPSPMAAQLFCQLHHFTISEKLPMPQLHALQFSQLIEVINFARKTVPYYQEKFTHIPTIQNAEQLRNLWLEIPLLTRLDLQRAKDTLFTQNPIPSHEPSELMTSTGSTGLPVTVKGNTATQFFWNAITLREHIWHKHEFDKSFAVIRFTSNPQAKPPFGAISSNWGPATFSFVPTGNCHHLTICTAQEEAQWLQQINPYYLNCNPSTLRELTQHFAIHGSIPSNLRSVHTNSEIVEPELRNLVKHVLNVPLIDTYSAKEVGYIALQCPESGDYHIQNENILVEILNEKNQPCMIDEPGRVVVTTLHNFASPLIRYVIGDYAIPGEPCSCGRTLPVLKRILGRQRNVLIMPDGRRIWPSFASQGLRLMDLFAGAQFQVIQKSLTDIQIKLAHIHAFNPEQEEKLRTQLKIVFDYPFNFSFDYIDNIERGPGGKYEDFKCEIP
jgi:phenylacetate-CoA ligase